MKTAPVPHYWFPAKRYGWGWGLPCAWQGWLVLAVYAVLLAVGALVLLPSRGLVAFVVFTFALGLLLTAICWLTGEPPRWRWGDSRDSHSKGKPT